MKLRPRLHSHPSAGLSSSTFLAQARQSAIYLIALVLASGTTLIANSQSGHITSKVTDPQNVAVAGVLSKLVNAAGVVISEQRTDGQGKFEFNEPGKYQVTAEHPGFVKVIVDVSVAAGQLREGSVKSDSASPR